MKMLDILGVSGFGVSGCRLNVALCGARLVQLNKRLIR
jgi:hypothetical protein